MFPCRINAEAKETDEVRVYNTLLADGSTQADGIKAWFAQKNKGAAVVALGCSRNQSYGEDRERQKSNIIMKEYVRVRKNEMKVFGSILVVCHICHQVDIRKFIRANCRSGSF